MNLALSRKRERGKEKDCYQYGCGCWMYFYVSVLLYLIQMYFGYIYWMSIDVSLRKSCHNSLPALRADM